MSAKLPSLTVFFPYLNDSPAVAGLLDGAAAAADACAERHELLIVDDGSSPEEAARLDAAAAARGARVVRHGRNLGYGAAIRRGLAEASSEWVFYTDGDGQYDPGELALLVDLWRADPGLDFLNGRKTSRSDPFPRRVLGGGYRLLARSLFSAPVSDVNCDFRLIRTSLLRRLSLASEGGGVGLELTRAAAAAGARFGEAGVTHLPRRHGRSEFFRPRGLLQLARDLGRTLAGG
ncbi:MAG TPA: glycosyltransferase family 2 protein [Elusimicrobiota bacterium]|nr:glycosyltransferase family 2 protein [Elusimicrobiota bacterium]